MNGDTTMYNVNISEKNGMRKSNHTSNTTGTLIIKGHETLVSLSLFVQL